MNPEQKTRVLMITGDKHLFVQDTPPFDRLQIQKKYSDITPVFWGKGALRAPFQVTGDFDVITVQDPFWRGLVGLYISISKKAKLNVQLHADLNSQSFIRRTIAKLVLKRADSIRVVSSKLKTQVEELCVSAQIKVLPIYLDIERFKSVERKTQPKAKKNIFWIGRFEDEKNPMFALDILKEVLKSGVDAELIMLGAGALEDKLKKKAKSENLQVTFKGWCNPVSLLASADVVINTSLHEGYGATIVEALATGAPVVSLDVGVASEAGAVITIKDEFATAVTKTLNSNATGELKIPILTKDQWAVEWMKTL
jgi:glycosyltransferase involved in cell wall biosynthesis